MALITITIQDTPTGVSVGMVGEPQFHPGMPIAQPTGAQATALRMLEAMQVEEKEPSRIALLND